MKLKCPSCSKLLQIPDSAAGKVVKCPCGKQLRVPGGTPATGPAATRQPPAKPAGQPSARPTARPAPQPSAPAPNPQSGFGAMGLDNDMFDELTESDLGPVAVAPRPGTMPAARAGASPNPYASAGMGNSSQPTQPQNFGPPASQNQRLLNYFIDAFFFSIIYLGTLVFLGIIIGLTIDPEATPESQFSILMLANATAWSTVPLYFIFLEGIFGVTIAKLMTGTKVVSDDGGKPGFGKILGRTLVRLIPLEPLSFLFGDNTTGWHDTLSGTRVIRTR